MFGRIRVVGVCVRLGRTVKNTLKRGGTEKRGGETEILKRGIKLGQGVGALKRGEGWNPLTTYVLRHTCTYPERSLKVSDLGSETKGSRF